MFIGTPLINWLFAIVMMIIGCIICLAPAVIVVKLYVYLERRFQQWWESRPKKKTTYIHFEKQLWRFRFSYYHLYGVNDKKTIRWEYSRGWDK